MIIHKLKSKMDGLELELAIMEPKTKPIGIVQISHGMAEHKERYVPFMNFLAQHGYVVVIHDHRGHGKSIQKKEDLGYFYTKNINYIVEDLHQVMEYAKEKYPLLDVILFSHSMGTLVSRCLIESYDDQIKKLILCGPPTKNNLVNVGIFMAKVKIAFHKEHERSRILDHLTFGNYNKGETIKNGWICSDQDIVSKYNQDELCGYIFTNNGFLNLYRLMKQAYQKKAFQVKHQELPILIIAGDRDPVIQSNRKLDQLSHFLKKLGYFDIHMKVYPNERHEIINGILKEMVFEDILNFIK